MTEQELKEKIRSEIAKKHQILIDIDDPIFAILTANQIIYDGYINIVVNKISDFYIELESRQSKYLADAKDLAEKKINGSLSNVSNVINRDKNQALEDIKQATFEIKKLSNLLQEKDKENRKNNLILIAGVIAALLIGFFVGKLF